MILGCPSLSDAQKVGIVLSGGGSGGLAHIGVLKALEENGVPIDYITGSSIGSLIGAYYAAGFSPEEIRRLVQDDFFQNASKGTMNYHFGYLFKKRETHGSWLTLKFDPNNHLLKNLPTNVINSIPIDYYLMEMFSPANIKAKGNFDSLFIPFRCLASDIETKSSILFKNGDLSTAVRSSMSYPFYLRPLKVDGKLLFDGGLYNNYPVDVLHEEFHPDVVIGSNVSDPNLTPDVDDLYQQLRNIMMSQTNIDSIKEKDIVIEPWCEINMFNFEKVDQLIDSGYAATIRMIPQILEKINSRIDTNELRIKRNEFRLRVNDDITIKKITVNGLNSKQAKYIKRNILFNDKPIGLDKLRKRYFRLAADERFKSVYPVVKFDSIKKDLTLNMDAKIEKPFYVDVGAIISNRPISEAFLGLQYNHIGRVGFTAYANGYLGKLHSGGHAKFRFDFPGKFPFFLESNTTYARWDYFNSSVLFYDLLKPAYLIQEDSYSEIKAGIPVGNLSVLDISVGVAELLNSYYQKDDFTKLDTTDRTVFDFLYGQISYGLNTLNRKMYATEGVKVNARARLLQGQESYYPGSTSTDSLEFKNLKTKPWLLLKLSVDGYIKTFKRFRLGLFGEIVSSSQNFFSNYESSILSAPAFNPTPESQTFFIDQYRAHNYFATGVKLITTPLKNLDFRIEAYGMQPFNSIIKDQSGNAKYSTPFLYIHYIGNATLVYNTPVGPFSLGLNYYDQNQNPFSIFFHFGYIIFNKKSLD
ncbi:MAG: patatin-like phospholipase family protein [Bacteroidia bacterium]